MHFLWVGVYWVPRQSIEGRYHNIYIYKEALLHFAFFSTWRKVDKAQKVLLGLSMFLFLHLPLLLLLLLLHHRHLLTLPLHFAQFSHFLWSIFNWQFISLPPAFLALHASLPVCCLPRGTSLLLLLLMSSDWFLLSLAQTNRRRRRLLLLLLLHFSLPALDFFLLSPLENSSVILCRGVQSVLILSLVTEITRQCLPKERRKRGNREREQGERWNLQSSHCCTSGYEIHIPVSFVTLSLHICNALSPSQCALLLSLSLSLLLL